VTAEEALKFLGPYLTPYVAGRAASIPPPAFSTEAAAEPSEYVPEPVDGVLQPSPGNFSNQPYLGGGKKVPYIILPGKSSLSPRETAAGTVGQPHPAMIRGLPLSEQTGVSTIAQVVTAKAEVSFLHIPSVVLLHLCQNMLWPKLCKEGLASLQSSEPKVGHGHLI
jgi:hypothetical protein